MVGAEATPGARTRARLTGRSRAAFSSPEQPLALVPGAEAEAHDAAREVAVSGLCRTRAEARDAAGKLRLALAISSC